MRRFGFTQTELERARTELSALLEQRYAERDKTNSNVFAAQYVSSALNDTPILGIADEQALAQRFAPDRHARRRSTRSRAPRSRRPIASSSSPRPTAPSSSSPRSRRCSPSSIAPATDSTLKAYVDSTSDAPLVATLPTPGKIVSERTLPETGILEWKLSNGARVLLKPTDFKRDEVLFGGAEPRRHLPRSPTRT